MDMNALMMTFNSPMGLLGDYQADDCSLALALFCASGGGSLLRKDDDDEHSTMLRPVCSYPKNGRTDYFFHTHYKQYTQTQQLLY
jgi:hypothetical protein